MDIKEIHNSVRETYNRIAVKYHEMFKNEMQEKPFDREYLEYFSGMLPEKALICDAGCGPAGHIGRYLFDKNKNVFGIDISEKCIEIAKESNPGMSFTCTDYLDWDLEPGTLDGIISYYSIIYTPKKEVSLILEVFKQKLKKGGKLLIAVKKGDFEGQQSSVLGIKADSYFAEYQENELKMILQNSGFDIDEIQTRLPYEKEIDNSRIYCMCTKP